MAANKSRLTPQWFMERGVPVNPDLDNWIRRAQYLGKTRQGSKDYIDFEHFVMSVVENVMDSGNIETHNWNKQTLVLARGTSVPAPRLASAPVVRRVARPTATTGGGNSSSKAQAHASHVAASGGAVHRSETEKKQMLRQAEEAARNEVFTHGMRAAKNKEEQDMVIRLLRDEFDSKYMAGQLSFLNVAPDILVRRLNQERARIQLEAARRMEKGNANVAQLSSAKGMVAAGAPPAYIHAQAGNPYAAAAMAQRYTTTAEVMNENNKRSRVQEVLRQGQLAHQASRKEQFGADAYATQQKLVGARFSPEAEGAAAKGNFGARARRELDPEEGAERFFTQLSVAKVDADEDGDDVDEEGDIIAGGSKRHGNPIVGESQELERRYSRDEPTAEEIRPPSVLVLAFSHIECKARTEFEDPDDGNMFLKNQLKGMRQDLLVQNIRTPFATSVYERHARLSLRLGDLNEYQGCQAALKKFYRLGIHAENGNHIEEFTCYRLVYLALRQKTEDLDREIKELERGSGLKILPLGAYGYSAEEIARSTVEAAERQEAAEAKQRRKEERAKCAGPRVVRVVDGVEIFADTSDDDDVGAPNTASGGESGRKSSVLESMNEMGLEVVGRRIEGEAELEEGDNEKKADVEEDGVELVEAEEEEEGKKRKFADEIQPAQPPTKLKPDQMHMYLDVQHTMKKLASSQKVQQVLQLCAAIENHDSRRVLTLAVGLGCFPCMLDLVGIFLDRLRVQWLTTVIPSMKNNVPCSFLCEALGFAPVPLLPGAKLNPRVQLRMRDLEKRAAEEQREKMNAVKTKKQLQRLKRSMQGEEERKAYLNTIEAPTGCGYIDGSIANSEHSFYHFFEKIVKVPVPAEFDIVEAVQPASAEESANPVPPAWPASTLTTAVVEYNDYLTTRKDASGIATQKS